MKDFIFTIFVTLLICAIVESSDKRTAEINNCTEPLTFNVSRAETGSFSVDFDENCDIYTYRIKCFTKSSIIKVTSTFTDYSNPTSSKITENSKQIQVVLEELTTLSDGKKSPIVVKKWNIEHSNSDMIFYSWTTDLTVTVTVNGNWSQFYLNFSYEEVELKEFRKESKLKEGMISPWIASEGRKYRPNSIYVFQITKSEDMNGQDHNIDLELKKLQIDEGIGEYLLIGSGKDVFKGPTPLFITSVQSKKRIKINDENAYIVLVATSTRNNYSGFEITWKYNGTRIDNKEDKTGDIGLIDHASMPICIFNSSAALNEINKEDSFKTFRKEVASLATEFYTEVYNGKRLNIDLSQVRIVRVSGFVKEDKEEGLYVMVNIQHNDGKAVFDWKQMGHILEKYSTLYNSSAANGYRIKECPKKISRQSKWPLYLIAPILCCICLLIWNWKQTPFPKIFAKKIKKTQKVPEDDDLYDTNAEVNTIPKVRITNDQGRRYTLNNPEEVLSSGAEQDSDVEVFNKMDFKRNSSSRSNRSKLNESRSSTRAMKPEINMAFEKDDDYKVELQNIPHASTKEKEDNFYDSLNSQKSLLSNFVTDETKL